MAQTFTLRTFTYPRSLVQITAVLLPPTKTLVPSQKTLDLTWTLIKIEFTALFLMLYSTEDGQICVVTTLQDLKECLRT